MLFENVQVNAKVCDPNLSHQRVLHKYPDTRTVLLEDGNIYPADELDVASHAYKHLWESK